MAINNTVQPNTSPRFTFLGSGSPASVLSPKPVVAPLSSTFPTTGLVKSPVTTQSTTPAMATTGLYGNTTGYLSSSQVAAQNPPVVTPSTGLMSSTAVNNAVPPPPPQVKPVTFTPSSGLVSTSAPNFAAASAQNNVGATPVVPPSTPAGASPTGPQPFGAAVSGLVGIGQGNANTQTQGLLTQDIAKLQEQAATNIQNINNSGADLNFKQGEAANVRLAESAREASLGQEVSGLSNVQAQQANALNEAGNLAKPSASFPFVFNPATGQFTNASNGSVMSATDAAKAVLGGQMSYDQAKSALSYLGGTAETQLQSSLQSAQPGVNINQLQSVGAGQSAALANLPTMTAANTQAKGIEQTIISFLQQNPEINPGALTLGNTLQQWIQGKQLGNAKYQTLFDALNEYASTLAPVLGFGGNVTDLKTQIAQSFVNAQASGQSIQDVLNNISSLADSKIANFPTGVMAASNVNAGGGSSQGGGAVTWDNLP